MESKVIVSWLKRHYPGKKLYFEDAEIICEIERTKVPDQSTAIAFIDQSKPHFHTKTTEVYIVESGVLEVYIQMNQGGSFAKIELAKDDVLVIHPMQVHFAKGDSTRVRVVASPAWDKEDYREIRI